MGNDGVFARRKVSASAASDYNPDLRCKAALLEKPTREHDLMGNVTYDFTGMVALVTGAASGLGLATAQAFAHAGAKVVLADINAQRLQQAVDELKGGGAEITGIPCDVQSDAGVKSLIDQIVSTYGRLDSAFNNAGIVTPKVDIHEMSEQEYDRVLGINLKGVFNCMKYELQQMRSQGSGSIVNCSSLSGLVGAPGRSQYHAAKHGVLGMTKSAAIEVAALGIRVNAVCPGTFYTPTVERLEGEKDINVAEVEASVPIRRMGRLDELADSVLWLCSSGSTYVIGQPIAVDGGYTIQ